jgi:hypothetical protein
VTFTPDGGVVRADATSAPPESDGQTPSDAEEAENAGFSSQRSQRGRETQRSRRHGCAGLRPDDWSHPSLTWVGQARRRHHPRSPSFQHKDHRAHRGRVAAGPVRGRPRPARSGSRGQRDHERHMSQAALVITVPSRSRRPPGVQTIRVLTAHRVARSSVTTVSSVLKCFVILLSSRLWGQCEQSFALRPRVARHLWRLCDL